MNTTDLRTLLAAPMVSRAAFFANYLDPVDEAPETASASDAETALLVSFAPDETNPAQPPLPGPNL